MRTGKTGNRGSALVEVAVLLPVYVLLLVGMIYFANQVLCWQEVSQSARYVATNVQGGFGGGGTTGIAKTNGAGVSQGYFLYFQGNKDLDLSSAKAAFDQQQIRDELIKASWTATQTFTFGGGSTTSQSLTGAGAVVYPPGNPAPGPYAFDGDDALIAREYSDWLTRASALLELTSDPSLIHVVGLPAGKVTAHAEAVLRRGDGSEKRRVSSGSDPGGIGLAEDLISRFGAAEVPGGSVPMPHYPDFMPTKDFWSPN